MMVDPTLKEYRSLVHQYAHRMRLGKPACVELDDLVQAGMIGLLEAGQRYKPGNGVTFIGYACSRIQGAMIDELRSNDLLPRRLRRLHRDVDNAICRLQHRHFRVPLDTEVASELGISPAAYKKLLALKASPTTTCLQDLMAGEDSGPGHAQAGDDADEEDLRALEIHTADVSSEPSTVLHQHQMAEALATAIAMLPLRQRTVLEMYYGQDLNLKQIGLHLGVTESRVSQLLSQTTSALRQALTSWRNDNTERQ